MVDILRDIDALSQNSGNFSLDDSPASSRGSSQQLKPRVGMMGAGMMGAFRPASKHPSVRRASYMHASYNADDAHSSPLLLEGRLDASLAALGTSPLGERPRFVSPFGSVLSDIPSRQVTGGEIGMADHTHTLSSQGAVYLQYEHASLLSQIQPSTKGGDTHSKPVSTSDNGEGDEGGRDDLSQPRPPTEADIYTEQQVLAKYPMFVRIDKSDGNIKKKFLHSIQDLLHPDDWWPFVRGQISLNQARFHADAFFLPRFMAESYDFHSDDTSSITGMAHVIPTDDESCLQLNQRILRRNHDIRRAKMDAVHQGQDVPTSRPARYVTLISDKGNIPGPAHNQPENVAATGHSNGALPGTQKWGQAQVDIAAESRMTASAVRTRCSGIMSSIEETYKLAIGVCAFCPVYVKLVRSFDQLATNPFYTEPLQVVYAEYDTCHGGCADNCTRHQRKCLAGYCHNCDHPLVVVAQRLQTSYGSFDNEKPFDSKALLEKRLCRKRVFCRIATEGSGRLDEPRN